MFLEVLEINSGNYIEMLWTHWLKDAEVVSTKTKIQRKTKEEVHKCNGGVQEGGWCLCGGSREVNYWEPDDCCMVSSQKTKKLSESQTFSLSVNIGTTQLFWVLVDILMQLKTIEA